jgi:hypothetical protein
MFVLSWKMTLIVLPTAALSFLLGPLSCGYRTFFAGSSIYRRLNGSREIFSGRTEGKAFGYHYKAAQTREVNQKIEKVGQRHRLRLRSRIRRRLVINLAYILIVVIGRLAGGLRSEASRASSTGTILAPANDQTN